MSPELVPHLARALVSRALWLTLALGVISSLGACMADASTPLTPDGGAPVAAEDARVPGPAEDAAVLPPGADASVAPDATTPPTTTVDPASRHPQLLAKDGEQLSRDLAQALGLARTEVCQELGRYDCAHDAHRIVLGGVEPYVLRIDTPLTSTPVTGPIAVDRIALAACGARATRDFGAPSSAVVFGALARGEADAVSTTVEVLYDKLLARAPDAHERTLVATLATDTSPRDFAVLACFVVATSLESLFY